MNAECSLCFQSLSSDETISYVSIAFAFFRFHCLIYFGLLKPLFSSFYSIDYFSYVGEVVSVRLIVNPEGKNVGYGFAETNEWWIFAGSQKFSWCFQAASLPSPTQVQPSREALVRFNYFSYVFFFFFFLYTWRETTLVFTKFQLLRLSSTRDPLWRWRWRWDRRKTLWNFLWRRWSRRTWWNSKFCWGIHGTFSL